MSVLSTLRRKKVITLADCPCCGEGVLRVMAPGEYARAYFDCGSVFSAEGEEPIKAVIPCPRPAVVAARALNEEADADLASIEKEVA